MANAKVGFVMITDEYGKEKPIRPISVRIEEFHRDYPPKEFRVIFEVADELSQRPGLQKLYETLISSGRKPEEVGLPPLCEVNAMVFTAKLVAKDDTVLRNPSAQCVIEKHKDRERTETAALSRLLNQLGYGSEIIDEDELTDIRAQGKAAVAVGAPEAGTVETGGAGVKSETPAPTGKADPVRLVTCPAETGSGEQPAANSPAASGKPSTESTLLSLRRMIADQAARHGVKVEDLRIDDKTQATKLLKRLMAAKSEDAAKQAVQEARVAA